MTVDVFHEIWDWAGIELGTPGSAVRLATDCDMGPGVICCQRQTEI